MTISINLHHMVSAKAKFASDHSWVTITTKQGDDLVLHLDDNKSGPSDAQKIAAVLTEVIGT